MAPTIPDHGPPPGNPQNILGPTANTDKELERTFSTISTASTLSSQDCGLEPPNHQPPLGPILSRIVTSRTNIVPRRKRRGLFANLSIIPEVENPYEYARATKKLITLVVAIAGAAAPMASAILFPALEGISEDFHAPASLTNLSVALYMLGMGIFPLWWSSFAERIGYRTIYIVSFVLYVVSNVCCAVSVNIGMFIVFRICSGASASSAQTIGAGTISNIWETKERGKAMGLFYLGPLCGPLISPIVGGLLTNRFGWRSTMWFLAAFGALAVVMMIFCLPETYREKVSGPKVTYISEKQAEVDLEGEGLERTLSKVTVKTKKKASQWIRTLKALFVDPLRSLIFIRFPPVLLTVYWASLAFGCLVCRPFPLGRDTIAIANAPKKVHPQRVHPDDIRQSALQIQHHHHRMSLHPQLTRLLHRLPSRRALERQHHAQGGRKAAD